jgi:hypothetical protein
VIAMARGERHGKEHILLRHCPMSDRHRPSQSPNLSILPIVASAAWQFSGCATVNSRDGGVAFRDTSVMWYDRFMRATRVEGGRGHAA